jgi:kynurenine formamidase
MRRLIDLSIYLENDVVSDPAVFRPEITYIDHQASAPELLAFFPEMKQRELPDGEAWAIERVQLTTHNGTHLDRSHTRAPRDRGGQYACGRSLRQGRLRRVRMWHGSRSHPPRARAGRPADGFSMACFPVKIRGASAGWTRPVAIFDDATAR